MALEVDRVARVTIFAATLEEVVVSDLVQRRAGSECTDVATDATATFVGANHHRHRIPTNNRLDPPLEFAVAWKRWLVLERDRVDVRRAGVFGRLDPLFGRAIAQLIDQEADTIGALALEHVVKRSEPLLGLGDIDVDIGDSLFQFTKLLLDFSLRNGF